MDTSKANIARILQNMIEEAEENIANVEESNLSYKGLVHIAERRAELEEAMELVAALNDSD